MGQRRVGVSVTFAACGARGLASGVEHGAQGAMADHEIACASDIAPGRANGRAAATSGLSSALGAGSRIPPAEGDRMAVSTTLSGHGDSVYAVYFAPDGARIVS